MGTDTPNATEAPSTTQGPAGNGPGSSKFGMSPTVNELLSADLGVLMARASAIRDSAFGTRVTYSPKVFIPLTRLCNSTCGYCTFAQAPANVPAPYLSIEEVVAIARAGARQGCHEALFTLGERPEDRYEVARDWLRSNAFESTVHYVAEAAKAVLKETGLLPHANCGAISAEELAILRPLSASQGMMLESLNPNLECHRLAPDKTPARRLATLEAAGVLQIPFTTGILVGIGESRADRIEALRAIVDSHQRHGHVQEVIVQNFVPKERTLMRNAQACPGEEELWTLAVARIMLPATIHLQAPPNLTDDFGSLLDAGIDDWGGVSPVTADHVNPERPWPAVDRLREVTEAGGFSLAPRLTIYPEFAVDPKRWLDAGLGFSVMDRSDSELLGRDDPGAFFPEKVSHFVDTADGAEVVLIGDRSTGWYSGASTDPTQLVRKPQRRIGGAIREVLDGVVAGEVPGQIELETLFVARGAEVEAIAEVADHLRSQIVGEQITWVHNRNINYTNVCTFKCKFCGFSKGPLSLNLRGKPYLLTLEDVADRVREAWDLGATEVTLQGGIHPDFDGEYYLDVCRAVKEAAPDIHVHGFTALEVTEGARRSSEDLETYLRRLKDAGLRSLPGTAAEILDDDIRAILCPDKINTQQWLDCHEIAHRVGLGSNVTIMHGSVEGPQHWARHMIRTREVQARTGGFTEFIPLPFVHMASPIYLQRKSRRGPTFREVVLMHAVGRIAYANGPGRINNVQASWVKIGVEGVRQLLQAGVNDLGGTLMNENISRAAGATHGQGKTPAEIAELVHPFPHRPLKQRTTLYGDPALSLVGHS
jgi:FO synthase